MARRRLYDKSLGEVARRAPGESNARKVPARRIAIASPIGYLSVTPPCVPFV